MKLLGSQWIAKKTVADEIKFKGIFDRQTLIILTQAESIRLI